MDRIAEIKDLEFQAEKPENEVSTLRWKAARLIWQEVEAGTSRRGLADEIGKSHTHVRFMYKCWDIVGKNFESETDVSWGNLPPFQSIYNSTEVRGEPEPVTTGTGGSASTSGAATVTSRGRTPGAAHAERDRSWIEIANEALQRITEHPAFWPLLKDSELDMLRSFIPKIQMITDRK